MYETKYVTGHQLRILLKFNASTPLERDIKHFERFLLIFMHTASDEVAEWLRRWTANPLGSARVGSNPILVARLRFYGVMVSTLDFESSDPSSNLGRTL